jgi:ribose transport system permease protein
MTSVEQTPTAVTSAVEVETHRPRLGLAVLAFLARYGSIIVLVGMCVVFSFASPYFLSRDNLMIVLDQVAIVAVLAGGLTVVLAAGQFDLSIGYVASYAGIVAAGSMALHDLSVVVSVAAGVMIGALVGLVNGLIVSKLKVNALVTTLGIGTIVIGLNFVYHSGTPITDGIPESFVNMTLSTSFLGLSNLVLISALIMGALWVFLNYTAKGQELQALGGNEEAASIAGIRVDRIRTLAFVIAGTCAGAGGVLLASSIAGGQSTAADGYLLDAYAAAFLGSAVLRHGEFHILGTVVGVLTVGIGFNGLALFDAPSEYQYIFKGGLLIVAVGLSTAARSYASGPTTSRSRRNRRTRE